MSFYELLIQRVQTDTPYNILPSIIIIAIYIEIKSFNLFSINMCIVDSLSAN